MVAHYRVVSYLVPPNNKVGRLCVCNWLLILDDRPSSSRGWFAIWKRNGRSELNYVCGLFNIFYWRNKKNRWKWHGTLRCHVPCDMHRQVDHVNKDVHHDSGFRTFSSTKVDSWVGPDPIWLQYFITTTLYTFKHKHHTFTSNIRLEYKSFCKSFVCRGVFKIFI